MDCLFISTSCFQPGLCSKALSVAAGLCDGLFGLFQGFLLPARCSLSSCGPSQPPSACRSLCCVLKSLSSLAWESDPGWDVSSQILLVQVFDARGLLPTGILSAGQSFPTHSLHFSEACLVLLERRWRISLMVKKVFLDFTSKFLVGSAVPLVESSSHLPACKISLLYLTSLSHLSPLPC